MTAHKYFTPQEANQRLPYVHKIVAEILDKGKRLQALTILPHATESIQTECEKLEDQIEVLMEELQALGCFFKDWNFEIGLVDFPARIDGQEVLLCWRSDEPRVQWYHGFEEGYTGRKPIPQHLLV